MTRDAGLAAEDLVYAVALDELDLTDDECARIDLSGLVASTMQDVRIALRKAAGRTLTVEDYQVPAKPPANVVNLFRSLEERANRQRPVS